MKLHPPVEDFQVLNSMFALKVDVEKYSGLLHDYGNMRIPMVSSLVGISFTFLNSFQIMCLYWTEIVCATAVKFETTEAFCCECMESFSNAECLKAHILSSHQYVNCEICGSKQLRKNIKRHLRSHGAKPSPNLEVIKCHFPNCEHVLSTVRSISTLTLDVCLGASTYFGLKLLVICLLKQSNLRKHVKAVHLKLKPFACCYPDCRKRFSYKHVRDNHEKTGCHVYTPVCFLSWS